MEETLFGNLVYGASNEGSTSTEVVEIPECTNPELIREAVCTAATIAQLEDSELNNHETRVSEFFATGLILGSVIAAIKFRARRV